MTRCREHNLNFTPCGATINVVFRDKFNYIIKYIIGRLEQNEKKPTPLQRTAQTLEYL